MANIDWSQVKTIFHTALALPQFERRQFVDTATAGNRKMAMEVESLLAAHNARPQLEPICDGILSNLLKDRVEDPMTGKNIGRYRLKTRLGSGGMAHVYLAERLDGHVPHPVAVKIIKWGLDDQALRRRFEIEKQALASLHHPNIAKFLDAGLTNTGVPYLVMDYIAGHPIDRYADIHDMPINARLDLFRKVCEAVQYAHQHLVIHRDIKPSNILVNANGQPILLDFGIAKLLTDDAKHGTRLTKLDGRRPMTPTYASPEQLDGGVVTTSSDVFSLGVVLYELLTGELPHGRKIATPNTLPNAVAEFREPRASSMLTALDRKSTNPRNRDIEDRPHSADGPGNCGRRRALPNDVGQIAFMALRPEPERRYASVQQLSDDIDRFTRGLPVHAHADTIGYRVSKFVGRNKAAIATATSFLLLVFAGMAGTIWQARVASIERDRALSAQEKAHEERLAAELNLDRAQAAEIHAQTQADTTGQVIAFLVDLFSLSDPERARGTTITAREILDRGTTRIREQLAHEPLVQATLMTTMGKVYRNLGLVEPAEALLRAGLVIRRAKLGADDPLSAESLHALGMVRRDAGDYREATELIEEALTIRRHSSEQHPVELATSLHELGSLAHMAGELSRAESLLAEALRIRRLRLGERDADTLSSMNALAALYKSQGRRSDAEPLYRSSLTGLRKAHAKDSPDGLKVAQALAMSLGEQGRFAEAEGLLTSSLATGKSVLGDEHPNILDGLHKLASLYAGQEKFDDAEVLFKKTIELRRKSQGAEHPSTLSSLNNLAFVYEQQLRFAEAEELHLTTLRIKQRTLGVSNPATLVTMNNLAAIYQKQKRFEDAAGLFKQVLDYKMQTLGLQNPSTLISKVNYAQTLLDLHRFDESATEFADVLEVAPDAMPARHVLVGVARGMYGQCLHLMERYEDAEQQLVQGRKLLIELLDQGHDRVLAIDEQLAATRAALSERQDVLTRGAPLGP